jgi:branched-chain amino acid aminotransferase
MATHPAPKALLNGRLVPKNEVVINLDTVAFKYGTMVFEGIRAYWNESREQLFVFRLLDHSQRLQQSVRVMRMETELTAEDYSDQVLQALRLNAMQTNAHIRQMVYVDGPGEMFVSHPVSSAVIVTPKAGWFAGKETGVHACVSSWQRITDSSMPARVKCAANYQNGRLALLQARIDGYDSTILLNACGKVAEEPRGCVFICRGGQVMTPKVTDDILESITRATLIQLFRELHGVEVIEREIDRTELYVADEVFICGSALEVVPVLSMDRFTIGNGNPGKMTTAVRDSYQKVTRGEMPQYQHWLTLC